MSNLKRTQVLLDAEDVNAVKKELLKQGISLAEYLRKLMKEDIKRQTASLNERKAFLLSLAGTVKSKGNPNDAINHNDIYRDAF